MSNYCFQQVTVIGDKDEVARFIQFVNGDKVFDVAKLAERLGVEAPCSSWSIEVINDIEPGKVVYELETEWEEDQELIPALAAKFPALRMLHEYAEPNMGFGGATEFVGGVVEQAYHSDEPEDFRFRTEAWITEFLQFWFTEGE